MSASHPCQTGRPWVTLSAWPIAGPGRRMHGCSLHQCAFALSGVVSGLVRPLSLSISADSASPSPRNVNSAHRKLHICTLDCTPVILILDPDDIARAETHISGFLAFFLQFLVFLAENWLTPGEKWRVWQPSRWYQWPYRRKNRPVRACVAVCPQFQLCGVVEPKMASPGPKHTDQDAIPPAPTPPPPNPFSPNFILRLVEKCLCRVPKGTIWCSMLFWICSCKVKLILHTTEQYINIS